MKEKGIFQFKQFAVRHEKSTMKIGTDAVLLGAWANPFGARRILDIGTGCGIIALMLAQRNLEADITGIDIDMESIAEATNNAKNSPWHKRIAYENTSLQSFYPTTPFDLIVSNPPFFQSGTTSPIAARKSARHTTKLSFSTLLHNASRLLSANGNFSVVVPESAQKEFIAVAKTLKLHLNQITFFKPLSKKKVERVMMNFCRNKTVCKESTLIHYQDDGAWTKEYIGLTKDFYLKL